MPFTPGQSGNPSGRPRGAAGVAKHAAECTDDGRELVDFLLTMMRDPDIAKRERVQCALALLDRVAGKPLAPSEITLALDPGSALPYPPNWHALPDGERAAWLVDRRRLLTGGRS